MRKIILDLTATLDGFIEGPNGELDWIVEDEHTDFGDILNDILVDIDAVFYGRVSYEKWGHYEPGENSSRKLKAAYELLHSKTKYVFSTTMADDDRAIQINSDIEERVLEIKRQPGKNIWLYGGGKLITTLVNLGLVDVYKIAIQPVILGDGRPLFSDITRRTALKLVGSKAFESGVLFLEYMANDKMKNG